MSRKEWLKVIVLILLPINAWLGIFYYLHWQHQRAIQWHFSREQMKEEFAPLIRYHQERLRIKEGERLQFPFPSPVFTYGSSIPPFGAGIPFLFLNISWIAEAEVWKPAIEEALKASPPLHIVLLYRLSEKAEGREREIRALMEMLKEVHHRRVSVIAGRWIQEVFGTDVYGILCVLCDGSGRVRVIEYYPKLKESPYWEEEVKDWRPKLQQAVKRALERFYGKTVGQSQ
jgi:hypothetical protein